LLNRYEYLSQQYQTLASQSQQDVQSKAAWKTEKPVYDKYLQQYQRALVSRHLSTVNTATLLIAAV
jgi:hypothetical protein